MGDENFEWGHNLYDALQRQVEEMRVLREAHREASIRLGRISGRWANPKLQYPPTDIRHACEIR